ncbi:MAG: Asp-tRNA(Asn)/Glu-tRNA(Gln) amidotransferase GatCAB subunit A [Terriglobales bacterium]
MQESILELGKLLRESEISPVDLTKYCLARIEKLNPTLNAFITVTAESALAEARLAEKEIRQGAWRGLLHGIPLALKDLIDTTGVATTAASELFKDRVPTQDAEVVRLLKSAGAVLLGKQNLHEFAYGGSSIVSFYGAVRNAWNPKHIAGGSSGGSATAVAAGLCYGAIGTDTAGSVREPAALCGIVGLKPTYGNVSADGVIPLSPALDHVGPLARSVSDAAVILEAISSSNGSQRSHKKIEEFKDGNNVGEQLKSLRVGIPRRFFYEDLDAEVSAAVEEGIRVLRGMVAELREIDIEVPTDRTLQTGEAYVYHSQFVTKNAELYQPETIRRILTGKNIGAVEIQKLRGDLEQTRLEIRAVFEKLDLLVTPATPIPAPMIAELTDQPELLRPREMVLLRNTRPINVWGLPAISIPCGFTARGLPIGMQIIGRHWEESLVLQLALAFEQATNWHKRRPGTAS